MVQFWAHKEVVFVHCCVLQFSYCAVVMAKDFDAMEVCCETVVTCVDGYLFILYLFIFICLLSLFIYNVFSHSAMSLCCLLSSSLKTTINPLVSVPPLSS